MPHLDTRPQKRCAVQFLAIVLLAVAFAPGAIAATTNAPKMDGYKKITADDVLTYKKAKFHLDGQPFAEISFNLFDLFWVCFDAARAGKPLDATNPTIAEKEKSLQELHDRGFRTVRVFGHPFYQSHFKSMYNNPSLRKRYYKAVDTAISLAEKHHIGIVWSLGVGTFDDKYGSSQGWKNDGETQLDLIGNPDSKNRAFLYSFLEDFITRYRDRPGIVMWELSNEMTLHIDLPHKKDQPTLMQLARFIDDVSKKIKSLDPIRLISSGGSILREHAWGLYTTKKWTRDNLDEHRRAYRVLYKSRACEVVDIHYYYIWGHTIFRDKRKTQKMLLTPNEYRKLAISIRKPFMIGEFAALPGDKASRSHAKARGIDYFDKPEEPASEVPIQQLLDQIVEGRVQLSYYWAYRTSHRGMRGKSDITPERTPRALQQIIDANRRLKEKLGVPLP